MFLELINSFSSVNNQKSSGNKEEFHVGPIEFPSHETSLSGKVIYGMSSVLTLGILPFTLNRLVKFISKMVLPALDVSKEEKLRNLIQKNNFLRLMPDLSREFDLKMEDGAVINGMGIFQDKEMKKAFCEGKAQNQKWVIYFNGNMQFYENNLYNAQSAGKDLEVNYLIFNYRGVGESKGAPTSTADLIADGEACVKYLLSKGIPEENIYIDGLSLGGGIGTQVASLHEKIGLINFNSFSSLSQISSVFMNSQTVGKLMISLGWELDSIKAFEKIKAPKLIVYHNQDLVMPYENVCFYKMMKEHIKRQNPDAVYLTMHKGKLKERLKEEFKPPRVKLLRKFSGRTQAAHVYDFKSDPAYPQIKAFVKDFFAKSTIP